MNIRIIGALILGLVVIGGLGYLLAFWEGPKPEQEQDVTTVKLYYYNAENDKDAEGNIQCSRQGLVSVEREVSQNETVIEDTIRLLLREELAAELPGVTLESAILENGVLTLEFADPQNKTVGGSCRVGILWFQIEATAKQFEGVEQVRFLPEELFQP
ncbi:MAG TPA: GerMN domain-containing protein [Candidatus Paceibacterota bacterium]|nr:GerMN domain-containing protein [Candidatus Paceibacterota bacterium]